MDNKKLNEQELLEASGGVYDPSATSCLVYCTNCHKFSGKQYCNQRVEKDGCSEKTYYECPDCGTWNS